MKVAKKHLGLIMASLIALSFNSHFAQAARKTREMLQPGRVFAFKRVGKEFVMLAEEQNTPLVVKKTAVQLDRKNIYIGGYVVNASDRAVSHARIFPSFVTRMRNPHKLSELLVHDEKDLSPREIRRFVIVRPIAKVKELLESNLPVDENCILNCREM